jgi:HEAT repeat protein
MGLFGPPNIERMKADKNVPGLIKALRHKQEPIRQAAIDALVYIFQNSTVSKRKSFIQALEKSGWQPSNDALGAVYWIVMGQADKCVSIGAPAVESLIIELKDEHSQKRYLVTEALGKIGDARAVEPLIATLKDKHLRWPAVRALKELGDARSVEPLVTILMKDGDGYIRSDAAKALVKIGLKATDMLIATLRNEHADARSRAAEVLGEIGDARAVEPLVGLLKDKVSSVRYAAATALDQLNWQPDNNVSGAAYWIQKRKWEQCVAIGAPAVESLITALDETGSIRKFAAQSLVKIYSTVQLDTFTKNEILQKREIINTPHNDHTNHSDACNCNHYDHVDFGIGVDFPL